MARIAMLVPVWVGHLNPMTALGNELAKCGHEVTVLSFPDARERVEASGLGFQEIGVREIPRGEWPKLTTQLARKIGFPAARFTIEWIARMTRVFLGELPEVLRVQGYDGLVSDQVCYGGNIAAELAGVPLAIACNALPIQLLPEVPVHMQTWPAPKRPFERFRNRFVQWTLIMAGQPFIRPLRDARRRQGQGWQLWHQMNAAPPSLVQVAQLPECLDFPRPGAPDNFHHTGPWHRPHPARPGGFDWSWLDGRPFIYASLGTLQNGLDHLYQTILDACSSLPVQLVLTLGRDDGPRPSRVPPNAQVLGYGPQLELLDRASMVITHAGLNTTLESLSRGLPMVALPIANEQPGIAARIRHAGVGDWLSIRRLDPGKLAKAVERVRTVPSYRQRAAECAREIAAVDGLPRAAQLIEHALIERRPVLRNRRMRG